MKMENEYTAREKTLLKKADELMDIARDRWRNGEFARTEAPYKRALEIREKIIGSECIEIVEALQGLGYLEFLRWNHDLAETYLVRTVSIIQKTEGRYSLSLTNPLYCLAELYFIVRQISKSFQIYRRIVTIAEKNYGLESPKTAKAIMELANRHSSINENNKAKSLYLLALYIRETTLGADHPDVAQTCQNLGQLYMFYFKDPIKGEAYMRRAYSIFQQSFGDVNMHTQNTLYLLADYLGSKGRIEEADKLYEKWFSAMEQMDKTVWAESSPFISSYMIYRKQSQRSDELPDFLKNVEQEMDYEDMVGRLKEEERTLGKMNPKVARTLFLLSIYFLSSNRVKAEKLLKRSLNILEKTVRDNHPDIAKTLYILAKVYMWLHRWEDAEHSILRALDIMVRDNSRMSKKYAEYLQLAGDIRREQNRPKEARKFYEEALLIIKEFEGMDNRDMTDALWRYSDFLVHERKWTQAEKIMKVLVMLTSMYNLVIPDQKVEYLNTYADILVKRRKTALAKSYREEAARLKEKYDRYMKTALDVMEDFDEYDEDES